MTQTLAEYDLTPMTLPEWENFHHEQTHELVEGVPVMSPPERIGNRQTVARLSRLLTTRCPALEPLPEAGVLISTAPATVRVPDLIVGRGRLDPRARQVEGADLLLAVEALSPSTRETDLVHKRREFAVVGIPAYLIVDTDTEQLILFTDPTDGRYTTAATGCHVTLDLDGAAIEISIDDLI